MSTMAVISLLLCVFAAGHVAAEDACAACTSTYNSATTSTGSDVDCALLKVYLDCLETAAGTSAGCDLVAAQAQKISEAVCKPVLPIPCSCQKTFWGSDLSGNNACGPLGTYIECLTNAGKKETCKTVTKASEIISKPQGRLAALTCHVPAEDACATCTSTYNTDTTSKDSDGDCAHLKDYLDCLETAAGTSAGCDLVAAQAKKISDAVCKPVLPIPCSCQKTFWGSDLSGNNACGPLGTYIECLTNAGKKETCKTVTKASEIISRPQGRLAALTCNAGMSHLKMYSTTVVFLPLMMAFLL